MRKSGDMIRDQVRILYLLFLCVPHTLSVYSFREFSDLSPGGIFKQIFWKVGQNSGGTKNTYFCHLIQFKFLGGFLLFFFWGGG